MQTSGNRHIARTETGTDRAGPRPGPCPQDGICAGADYGGMAGDQSGALVLQAPQDRARSLHRQLRPAFRPCGQIPGLATALIGTFGAPDLGLRGALGRLDGDRVAGIGENGLVAVEPRQHFRIACHQKSLGAALCRWNQHRPVAEGRTLAALPGQGGMLGRKRTPRHLRQQRVMSQCSEKEDLRLVHLAYRHTLLIASITKPQSAPPIKSVPHTGMVSDCMKYSIKRLKVASTASHGAL
jgi:hypothetical protein